jgi:dTDP-4-dehydrorhamnose 3,5-epimerase-like enzyme
MERGLCTHYPQWSISFNHHRGTLRGLHFQLPRMKRSSSSVAREGRYSTWWPT